MKQYDLDGYARGCKCKKAYASELDAKEAADWAMSRRARLKLDWYRCKYCGLWHLTETSFS